MLYTTGNLVKFRDNGEVYKKLYHKLHQFIKKEEIDLDTPIPLSRILEIAGLNAAIWTLRCVLPLQQQEANEIATIFAEKCTQKVDQILTESIVSKARKREIMARVATWTELWAISMESAFPLDTTAEVKIQVQTFLKMLENSNGTFQTNSLRIIQGENDPGSPMD